MAKKGTNNQEKDKNSYIALGLCFGVALGAAFNNLALGISLGVAVGAILDSRKNK